MSNEGSSAPFALLSNSDHGPLIIVTTYILLITSCLAVFVKIWTRLSTTKKLVATDWVMLTGLVLAIAQAFTLTIAVDRGLGRKASDLKAVQLEDVSKAYHATNILTMVVLAATKSSVTLLIISIQPRPAVLLSCYIFLGVVAAWCVTGIFALAFQCGFSMPWAFGGAYGKVCVDQFGIHVGLSIVNILTDLATVALAVFMMYGVQTNMRRKWTVVALFGLRVAIPPFVICALVTYHTYYYSQPQDRTWHAVAPTLWTQLMLNLSIVTACIPSIKRFFMDVQSGLMGATISEQYEMTHSGGKATKLQGTSETSMGSRLASRLGIMSSRSQALSDAGHSQQGARDGTYTGTAHGRYTSRVRGEASDTESIEGLTQGVIHQKIVFQVEFEERESKDRGLS